MPKSLKNTPGFDITAQLDVEPDVERLHFSKCGQSQSDTSELPYTIAHISDPHLSRRYYRGHIKSLKMLLRAILEAGCDHIVISGDLVSTADPDDFYLAREVFSNYGLLDSRLLTVVPGNHDVFGGPHRAVDVLSFPQHIRSVDYQKNLDLFYDTFPETFVGVKHLVKDSVYPFIKQVGPFALLGLNSIPPWSFLQNPLGTNGIIEESQLEALRALNAQREFGSSVPVTVVHHHFNDLTDDSVEDGLWKTIESNTMRMKKRRRLLKVLHSLGTRYVLHGHIHRNELYERNGIRLANGAGAVCDDPLQNLKYNALSLTAGTCELTTRHLPIPYQTSTVTQRIARKIRTTSDFGPTELVTKESHYVNAARGVREQRA
jgi:3',5'-cyclic-AMP phosphodiesterase